MVRQILAWQCRYCGGVKKTKHIAERHEITCLQNPDAKNCVLCVNSITDPGFLFCSVRGIKCSSAVSASCEQFQNTSGKMRD